MIAHLVKKFPAFYGRKMLISAHSSSLPLDPILSHMTRIHTLEVHLLILLSCRLWLWLRSHFPSGLRDQRLCASFLSCSSYPARFHRSNKYPILSSVELFVSHKWQFAEGRLTDLCRSQVCKCCGPGGDARVQEIL
jgi:hypothetical protein